MPDYQSAAQGMGQAGQLSVAVFVRVLWAALGAAVGPALSQVVWGLAARVSQGTRCFISLPRGRSQGAGAGISRGLRDGRRASAQEAGAGSCCMCHARQGVFR